MFLKKFSYKKIVMKLSLSSEFLHSASWPIIVIYYFLYRFTELSLRCSKLVEIKRGNQGPPGRVGQPGRDGLNGLPGRDGPAGRDGRDCPCQNRDLSAYLSNTYGAAFTGRTKRTIEKIPDKNATLVRFGRNECPKMKRITPLTQGGNRPFQRSLDLTRHFSGKW